MKILACKFYPTATSSDDEHQARMMEVLDEAMANVESDHDRDSIAELRELMSNDVLDAATLTTDN